ncbi:MAG TPA: hypothetical protein VNU97_06800 [Rhizomicrobium sp.]|jgi:hypothetical protein|nr:hypothetical protein [Rhizomicrobium sp.]
MRKLFLAFCGLALLGTTPALADSCVRRNDIRDWNSPARRTLVLENYAHQKILLTMNGTCLGFGVYDSFQVTGLMAAPASCIVAGDIVRTHWAGEPGVCTILSVTPYTGEMHPKGQRHLVM